MKMLMDEKQVERAILRISHEIIERNKGIESLALIGIRTGGAILAERIRDNIQKIEKAQVPLGILDITLYRDDLEESGPQPIFMGTHIDFDINQLKLVLIDDVLFTGRTIRCALDHLIDLGRPKAIQLAVLVDRGHRELPIKADYVGKNIPTELSQKIKVAFSEKEGDDKISVLEKDQAHE